MNDQITKARIEIDDIIKKALKSSEYDEQVELGYTIEIPADTSNGDFSTNLAMVGARAYKKAPKMIAEDLVKCMEIGNSSIDRVEVAGAGFINFYMKIEWFTEALKMVDESKENYGRTDYGKNKKVMIEFVSANPTGPMHIGNARGGAIGDCLASAFDWAGFDVTREFYVNDAGNQIEKFGKSLAKRYLQIYKGESAVEFEEDLYQGEDIKDLAQEFADKEGDRFKDEEFDILKQAITDYGLPKNIDRLERDLKKYRIDYDVWFYESELYKSEEVKKIIDILTERGLTYKEDDTIFYKATEFGAEKDEVIVRANGVPTYFAADIAYHYNKFETRKFDKVINVWGADHHGHVARIQGAMEALGVDRTKLDVVLMQLVRLMQNGEVVRVSKRSGKSITLALLLEEVPINSARFFFNLREASSHFDFDLDLAIQNDSKNPVFYVQYAHARTSSILAKSKEQGIAEKSASDCKLELLSSPEEVALMRHIASLPSEIIEVSKQYETARMTRYVIELANLFHKFYTFQKVMTEDKDLTDARLVLCRSVKQTIANVLTMLKVDAPESM